ncbi:acyl carrier protein [Marinicrinis sediminis]|uniref:Acyl carrier protein n=1 Tax=Marinicrinis sediminis TaxID=1652465 RepID=A0ABW5RF45_9BACL
MRQLILELLSQDGCGVLPKEEIAESKRLYDIGFDSLRYMEFVVLLEEKAGIAVPDEWLEIRAETTIDQLIKALTDHHG